MGWQGSEIDSAHRWTGATHLAEPSTARTQEYTMMKLSCDPTAKQVLLGENLMSDISSWKSFW